MTQEVVLIRQQESWWKFLHQVFFCGQLVHSVCHSEDRSQDDCCYSMDVREAKETVGPTWADMWRMRYGFQLSFQDAS